MWQCPRCNFENQNSSKRCHGIDCDEPTTINPSVEETNDTVLDFCPVCKKEMHFSKDSKKRLRWRWKCHGCKKLFRRKGEYVPQSMRSPEVTP